MRAPEFQLQWICRKFPWRQCVVWSLLVTRGLKSRRATVAVSCTGAHVPQDILLLGVRW